MLKYSVKFSLKKDSSDQYFVRARVSFHSQRVELYTGVKVQPEEWDGVRIKKRSDSRNQTLSKIENKVEDIFKKFDVIYDRFPTTAEFRKLFNPKEESEKESENLLFTKVIDLYIAEKSVSKQWEPLTLRKYEKLRNHIIAWKPQLQIDSVNQNTLYDLIRYFSTAPKNYKSGKTKSPHRNTTIRREINDYKRILKWAEEKGLYSGNAHLNFEQRYKGTSEQLSELVYLEWEELQELFNHDFSHSPKLDKVRDVFCFCCFSSLRFSDVKKLRKSDVRKDSIIVATKKTTDPLVIDLNDYSRAILEKYREFEHPDGLALPVISMDKTNEYLKQIGEELGWDTPVRVQYFVGNNSHVEYKPKKDVISTHAARRTFVISALRLGIPSDVIIKWTGHKDFANLKPYVKIVDDLKKAEMNKFNTPPKIPPKQSDV